MNRVARSELLAKGVLQCSSRPSLEAQNVPPAVGRTVMRDCNCDQITPLFTRRDVLRLTGCGFGVRWLLPAWRPVPRRPALWNRKSLRYGRGPNASCFFACAADRRTSTCSITSPSSPRIPASPARGRVPIFTGRAGSSRSMGKAVSGFRSLRPNLRNTPDKLCFIHSMQTDLPAHPQAFIRLHTGTSQFIRPSMGAWTLYGLGTENQNLPGFVSITPPSGFGGAMNYGAAFLPAIYQGTRIGNDNRPIAQAQVENLRPRASAADQRAELDFVQSLNRDKAHRDQENPEVDGIIESYELAFRMQSEMPAVMDLSKESAATKEMYGFGDRRTEDMGRKCLLARRMLEAGVRFVEISHGNWDHHFNISNKLPEKLRRDRPPDRRTAGRPGAARLVARDARRLERRVRPNSLRPGTRRPRSQQQGLYALDGRRWRERRNQLWPQRRLRLGRRGTPRADPRFARHDAGHSGLRSQEANVSPCGTRFPLDRRCRSRH